MLPRDVCLAIVESEEWKLALLNETMNDRSMRTTPMRKLIRKMPGNFVKFSFGNFLRCLSLCCFCGRWWLGCAESSFARMSDNWHPCKALPFCWVLVLRAFTWLLSLHLKTMMTADQDRSCSVHFVFTVTSAVCAYFQMSRYKFWTAVLLIVHRTLSDTIRITGTNSTTLSSTILILIMTRKSTWKWTNQMVGNDEFVICSITTESFNWNRSRKYNNCLYINL